MVLCTKGSICLVRVSFYKKMNKFLPSQKQTDNQAVFRLKKFQEQELEK